APPPPPPGRRKRAEQAQGVISRDLVSSTRGGRPGETPLEVRHQSIRAEDYHDRTDLAPVSGIIEAQADPRATDEATVHSPPGLTPPPVVDSPSEAGRRVGNVTQALRVPPTFARREGVLGDMLYVYTAVFGVAGSRRELAAVERKLAAEKQARAGRLADLARLALSETEIESDTMRRGRDELYEIEESRSRRAGAVAAIEEEIAALERERAEEHTRNQRQIETLRRELADTTEKLEPLERRAQAARRKATRLAESLTDLDRRLTRQETQLREKRPGFDDTAELEASIASLRAERQSVAHEEPTIAADLADLEPVIANLTATRTEAEARVQRLEREEREAAVRIAEMVTALRAKRAVEERAEAALERDQEEAALALGERLSVERPPELMTRLRAIDEHDLSMATLERRHVELGELVRGVDRWALMRGVLWLTLVLTVIAGAAAWYYFS
ncbi:MAG TPA: hypothetical protein VMZ28_20390, partial [Kofleriaceae bacterium]|nr:hypothetical protein [Kofleriaceae bacterium]